MGNNQTHQQNVTYYTVENTGIENIETPHYRNIYCKIHNNGNLVSKFWDDVSTCHQGFL